MPRNSRSRSAAPSAAPAEPERAAPDSDTLCRIRLEQHLRFLGLTLTRESIDELLAWAVRERPTPSALLEHVLGREVAHKAQHRVEHRILRSGLVERKTLEAFDWQFQPGLDKAFVVELGNLSFVDRHDDVIITGTSGTGKSHILKALGLRACQQGVSIRYARCVDLLDDLHSGLADNTYPKRLRAWTSPALLIIDDVGLGQIKKRDDEPTAAHTLYNLVDRRHGHASTAITSNIRLRDWGRYLGDATVTAAILDRLVMQALRIDIDGPSYRQHVATDRARKAGIPLPPDDAAPTPPAQS